MEAERNNDLRMQQLNKQNKFKFISPLLVDIIALVIYNKSM